MKSGGASASLFRRLGRWLFVGLGVLAILAAVALGAFRLLIGQIPAYQSEIKAFVSGQLGLDVDFASIDARLALGGPELSLRAATIGSGEGGGFLAAEQARIRFDPLALVFERRLEVSRLTLAGLALTLERDDSGTFRFGDRAIGSSDASLMRALPASADVAIRDSELHYVDTARGQSWRFDGLDAVVASVDGQVSAQLSLTPEADFAGPLEIRLAADLEAATGRADFHVTALDLGAFERLLPVDGIVPLAGVSDIDGSLEWTATGLAGATLAVDFDDFRIGNPAGEEARYETLAFAAEWQRISDAEWRIGLSGIELSHQGRDWDMPASAGFTLRRDDDRIASVRLSSDFVRLEDLAPVFAAFPDSQLADQWALFEPAGDLSELDFSFARRNDEFAYSLDMHFSGLRVGQVGPTPGLAGLSGRVQAGEDSGTIEFTSDNWRLDWPEVFPGGFESESLGGAIVWRQGRDVVQILSVDTAVGLFGESLHASFDLRLPQDGSSPTLELEASLAALDLVPAKAYLPGPLLPPAVKRWLERAVVAGRARDIEASFYGPLANFPFDDGSGQFRVSAQIEDASLRYLNDWPPAEELSGRIEFVNMRFSGTGSGRSLSNASDDIVVGIADMRQPQFSLVASTEGPLAGVLEYLRSAPLIATHLGPDLELLDARGGTGIIRTRLNLPLLDMPAYSLDAELDIVGGVLAVAGLGPAFSEINGTLRASEGSVTADAIDAVFLGGPITASLTASNRPGYRAELAINGETTAEAIAASFRLPHEDLFAGQTLWRGRMLMPALNPLATSPTRIMLESNLAGIALRFPAPLAKPPGEPRNLALDLVFAAGDRLEVTGNLGATRRFVLSFLTGGEALEFARGAVRFGGEQPELPIQAGILVDGRLESLALDDWLALADRSQLGRAGPLFLGTDLDVADFRAYGQQLGATALTVQRAPDAWLIDVASEPIAGQIRVPRSGNPRAPIEASMQKIYLAAGEGAGDWAADPRELPALSLNAVELGIGPRRFGRVNATVVADPRGLVLREFVSETPNNRTALSGTWFRGPRGARTSIDGQVRSSDVQATLTDLGLDPVVSGESARLDLSVFWDGAPGSGWLDHLNGEVSLFVDTGTLREIDPGAGRVVGLMSIAALPRRLMLDFRDVFEEGFAFDEIGGSFRIVDGNAYTNTLKFSGPAAEIGVVGRAGLGSRDYRQQIVVTSEPGNMLPTVAGLLAGPGAGAALFVFTRLFKEPLKGIGRASYCLSGSWDAPIVEPIAKDAPAIAASCADLPADMQPGVAND